MDRSIVSGRPDGIAARGPSRLARRAILAALLASPARAQEPFAEAASRRLVLNGTGVRRFFGFQVFRGYLYLVARESDAARIIASPEPKLLRLVYLRDVDRGRLVSTWEEAFATHCGCAVPPDFRARFRDLREGEVETWLFTPAGAEVRYGNEAPARVPAADAPRLLAYFIGADAPSDGLRRGLLGLS
ncbi:chalcone isomerase family protein [Roseomonas sp. CCTCC AB2023176]|uniref:chalcone isomerase family protein n=1 Tax=Roseomonas sp. CCTCC AB2023176 TaxID=3342640 RepID=UPI0035DD24AD